MVKCVTSPLVTLPPLVLDRILVDHHENDFMVVIHLLECNINGIPLMFVLKFKVLRVLSKSSFHIRKIKCVCLGVLVV
jgi:hypothetical protein